MRDKVRRSGAWCHGGDWWSDWAEAWGWTVHYVKVCISLTHTHVGVGRARREEVHARRTYSRLFPNHTRAGTRWSSFLYEKGSPRGNLARVLVVHLVEGGSSTTGEQTNCDLTRYVKLKKEANHVGPTLEARLYTLEYF